MRNDLYVWAFILSMFFLAGCSEKVSGEYTIIDVKSMGEYSKYRTNWRIGESVRLDHYSNDKIGLTSDFLLTNFSRRNENKGKVIFEQFDGSRYKAETYIANRSYKRFDFS
ncbi:hypothetical protein [Sphingobacterium micropteri]|uniref:hypothetical protein n=1 Tax=Sphingobacterium micropteri TaxID=2763501 RepID=UPI001CC2CACF|nr:hypothetical protein [Sphingobacterium micropteri]